MTEAKLDGEPLDEQAFRGKDWILYLFDHFRRDWAEVTLAVTCSLPAEVLDRFEEQHGEVSVRAVAHCRPTNAREGFALTRSRREPGRWKGKLNLPRDNFRGRVTVEATATATVHEVEHRVVAASEEWWVYFDPAASFRINGALPVRWCRFKDAGAPPIAKQFPDSAYVVDLDKGMPEVLLNADFDGLELLLEDKKSRSAVERALHDGQRMAIGRGVWMALIQDAVAAVRIDDPEDGEASCPEKEWQAEILRRVLPEIEPALSDAEALRHCASDWREHPGSAGFAARAEAVVGGIVEANKTLRGSLRALSKSGLFE